MSRHMIGANIAIFSMLDRYCVERGTTLNNNGSPRWIASSSAHRDFLIRSLVRDSLSFTAARKLARIEHSSRTFFCTTGFDHPNPLPGADEVPVDAAFLTVILAELSPRPSATIAEIRDIVEAGDKDSEPSYSGHDPDVIAKLFPDIRAFEMPALPPEATWRVFFKICIEECEFSEVMDRQQSCANASFRM